MYSPSLNITSKYDPTKDYVVYECVDWKPIINSSIIDSISGIFVQNVRKSQYSEYMSAC